MSEPPRENSHAASSSAAASHAGFASALPAADWRLKVMMFLEYSVKGLWFPLASVFLTADVAEGGLGFSDIQKGRLIASASAVGAICAPFIGGQLADRYFNTERFLAVALLFAGIVKFVTAWQTNYWAWLFLSMAYSVLYMPTMALTNSLAMAHLPDPKRQFPSVRVWGTLGWVAVAWFFPVLWLRTNLRWQWLPPFFSGDEVPQVTARMLDSMKAAGIVAVLLAAFCWFVLPKTPPSPNRVRKLAFARAFGMVRIPSFAILMIVTFLISCTHTLYFVHTGAFLKKIGLSGANVMPAMSMGQISELAVMALLGRILVRFGFRATMTLGCFVYFVRFALFGIPEVSVPVAIAAQFLHGFCFACFFAAGFIYIDRLAEADVKHSVQTVFTLVMFGLGPVVAGGWLNGWLVEYAAGTDATLERSTFPAYWQALAAISLVATVLMGLFFRDETETTAQAAT